jgi:uncharacterized protein YcgI (DUF1989 family)
MPTPTPTLTIIPARHGIATPLRAGQTIKIINTLSPSSPSSIRTQLSMQHTRASLNRTIPRVGDGLYNNERVKILTIVEDTTAGVHDTLIAACDRQRYEELGGGSAHRNCADNLVEGLGVLGELVFVLFFDFSCVLMLPGWISKEVIRWIRERG